MVAYAGATTRPPTHWGSATARSQERPGTSTTPAPAFNYPLTEQAVPCSARQLLQGKDQAGR
ncbi:hypothetical protein ACPA9J_02090 [Pseudomonas aeruginosa]